MIYEKLIADIVTTWAKLRIEKNISNEREIDNISIQFERHLKDVISWSQHIQFYGMSIPEYTDDSTICLQFDFPRKFVSAISEDTKIDEYHLLQDSENYILVGAPGSGKTTTLKRLARYLLTEEPYSKFDTWQCPIVVRLRELGSESSLYLALADRIGLNYEIKKIEKIRKKYDKKWDDFSGKYVKGEPIYESYFVTEVFVGDHLLETILPDILDQTNLILLFDGLDEVCKDIKEDIEKDISNLALNMVNSKIIVSCRTGDYDYLLQGFSVYEICPLDEKQIFAIASKWIDHPQNFIDMLNEVPYYDLASRPLFLTHLIVIYRNKGYLPDQPSSVYKLIIQLVLEKWDNQRKIIRISSYKDFGVEKKIEFLSALSYHLTYKYKMKRFSADDFIKIYEDIRYSFNLPEDEARDVAQEIETYTGIITESTDNTHEFSHLSLQEYLCASYLVREPFAKYFGDYLVENPAPIAVAISLSSNPSNWFAGIILTKKNTHKINSQTLRVLLGRLLLEKPYFSISKIFGLALIDLIIRYEAQLSQYFSALFQSQSVQRSFALALSFYLLDYDKSDENSYFLKRAGFYEGDYDFHEPRSGSLPKKYFDILSMNKIADLQRVSTNNIDHGVFRIIS